MSTLEGRNHTKTESCYSWKKRFTQILLRKQSSLVHSHTVTPILFLETMNSLQASLLLLSFISCLSHLKHVKIVETSLLSRFSLMPFYSFYCFLLSQELLFSFSLPFFFLPRTAVLQVNIKFTWFRCILFSPCMNMPLFTLVLVTSLYPPETSSFLLGIWSCLHSSFECFFTDSLG